MANRKYKNRSTRKLALSRRTLLAQGLGAAAIAGLGAGPLSRLSFADGETVAHAPGFGKAKQMVILYMGGGASHFETFDPKPGTTSGGPTKAIGTALDGVQIASTLPELAQRMNEICLVRGMTSKEGNHDRARYLMHTGYAPTPTLTHPGFGCVMSHEKGNPDSELPHYIAINTPGAGAGYLGVNHAPFTLRIRGTGATSRQNGGQGAQRRRPTTSSGSPVDNLELPRGMEKARRDRRLELQAKLNEQFDKDRNSAASEAQAAMFDRARRLMDSPKNTAFDVSAEKAATRDRFGRGQFGESCLVARRLIDQGVQCVEVAMGGWDTHDDNFKRVADLNTALDKGASALLDDLRSSGRLDETLVLWVGDFGRTPRITPSLGRGHYPGAWSLWLAGGGVKGGQVLGATDAEGAKVIEHPVQVPDLFASIAHATGIDGSRTFESGGRPISLVFEEGKLVTKMFS